MKVDITEFRVYPSEKCYGRGQKVMEVTVIGLSTLRSERYGLVHSKTMLYISLRSLLGS